MKILFISTILFLQASEMFGCDCDRLYWSYNYLRHKEVFICKIEKEIGDHIYKIKILEVFRGNPMETLFTGYFCGIAPPIGSTILIYGTNQPKHQWTGTGLCYGNTIIPKKPRKKSFNLKRKSRLDKEIDLLRAFRDEIQNTWGNYTNHAISDFRNAWYMTAKNVMLFDFSFTYNYQNRDNQIDYNEMNLAKVKVRLENSQLTELTFLDAPPRSIKRRIKKILKKKMKWNIPEKEFAEIERIELIEGFLYSK